MTKRFVLSGYFGFKNFGDEAILSVLVNRLKQDKHSVTVISGDPEYTKSQYKHIKSVHTFDIENIFGALLKSDALISGGGSLLQDSTSFKSLLYYLVIIFLAQILAKPVIIFAQGIGPINNPIGSFLAMLLLERCKYISVRDIKSFELLNSWGIDADLVCDPIFSTRVEQQKNGTVAIQLRSCKNLSNDFIERFALQVNNYFSDKTIEIYSFQDEFDLDVCKNFEKNLQLLNPNIKTILYSNISNNEIINNISKAEYLIAMRFHAIIIGLLAKSKILAINYDIKVEKLATEFELPMINLTKDFKDEFCILLNQNTDVISEKVSEKVFDWSGFDRTIDNI